MTYWLVGFVAFYNDAENQGVNIHGDAVFGLPTDSFMPGIVKRLVTKFVSERTAETKRRLSEEPVSVFLGSVLQINEKGFADYKAASSDLETLSFGMVAFNEQVTRFTIESSFGLGRR